MHVLRFIEKSLSRLLRLSFQVINNSISSSSKMAPTVKANAPSEVQIGELEMHSASYFCTRRRRGLFFCKHLTVFYDLGQDFFSGNLLRRPRTKIAIGLSVISFLGNLLTLIHSLPSHRSRSISLQTSKLIYQNLCSYVRCVGRVGRDFKEKDNDSRWWYGDNDSKLSFGRRRFSR